MWPHSNFDPILDSDFLCTPKTARMISERIQATAEVTIRPGRITAELTKSPRNVRVKVVNKPEGEKASGHWYQLVEIG